MFLLTASAHWGAKRLELIQMVPERLPHKELIVSATGWLEIIGAIGIILPATSQAASVGLALLLLVMFPANVRAARKKLTLGGKRVPRLLPRTALQIIFIVAILLAG